MAFFPEDSKETVIYKANLLHLEWAAYDRAQREFNDMMDTMEAMGDYDPMSLAMRNAAIESNIPLVENLLYNNGGRPLHPDARLPLTYEASYDVTTKLQIAPHAGNLLHIAVSYGHMDLVTFLVEERGANVNERTDEPMNYMYPLQIAEEKGFDMIAAFLRGRGGLRASESPWAPPEASQATAVPRNLSY